VNRFDDICSSLERVNGLGQTVTRDEMKIVINTKTEVFIDLVMSFGDQTEKDGGPPLVSDVKLNDRPQ
jgi:hypothetical protein